MKGISSVIIILILSSITVGLGIGGYYWIEDAKKECSYTATAFIDRINHEPMFWQILTENRDILLFLDVEQMSSQLWVQTNKSVIFVRDDKTRYDGYMSNIKIREFLDCKNG